MNGRNKSEDFFASPAEEYFTREVLEIHKSEGITRLGSVKPTLALSCLTVFILVYFALWKGVKSTGKVVWVTAIAPYIVLFCLLIRGITLDGASDGIRFYLTPKWEKLFTMQVLLSRPGRGQQYVPIITKSGSVLVGAFLSCRFQYFSERANLKTSYVCLSVCLCVCVCLSVYLSFCVCVCLSVCLICPPPIFVESPF